MASEADEIDRLPMEPLRPDEPNGAGIADFPAARGTGAAMVICPGGGYGHLAAHEGAPVARWLNTLGIDAYVLRYRLAPAHRHPAMLRDVQRAIRLARRKAGDPARVGVLGFSAGGHLAACACTRFTDGRADAEDPVERLSSRPDLGVLLYPVITMTGPTAHAGSRRNLLGETPPPDLLEQLSLEKQVTARTPDTFVFHTTDDPAVPVENSLLYVSALRTAGVPFEFHCFEHGRHGVGLASDDPILGAWTALCGRWLQAKGFGSDRWRPEGPSGT